MLTLHVDDGMFFGDLTSKEYQPIRDGINKNFKAINSDIYTAFNKRDKVRLQRSLSENMFAYAKSLHKESANKRSINPFLKKINDMKLMQARVYAENDHLLPEE